jgi:pilus assembly protein CpaC
MTLDALRRWRPSLAPRNAKRHVLGACLTLLLGLLASPASGQGAPETLGTTDTLKVEVRKGQVIRLPRPAATVFVADPEIADVQAQSASIVYLFGRRAGSTSLYAVDENDQVLLRTLVLVEHNLSALHEAIDQLAPDNRVRTSSVDGSIVLEGTVDTPVQAQELRELGERFLGEDETLLFRVKVAASTQVNLRVRVAEVSREVIKEFGINWEAVFETGDLLFGFATGRPAFGAAGTFFRAPPQANGNVPDLLFGQFTPGDNTVNTAIDALAQEGLVNVLAEPNLTALSGETASFLAGGEFPIPVATGDNNDIEIEFKEFGIQLAFTPTVLSGNRISMRVRPEVSELSDDGAIEINGLTIPALKTRRAETTVELGSGQSFAIGGLLSSDVQNAISKTPGIGDLPVLGTLFRSTAFRRNETELVIIVTPYLVRPVDEPVLATPGDGYKAPNDIERILQGRLHSAQLHPGRGGPQGPQGQRLSGPIGFVLE